MIKDDKKDDRNEITDVLSHFLEFTSVISNEYHTFLVKKSEKLASALYVITGFIDAQDPVRTKLRSSALDLITQSSKPHVSSPDAFGSKCAEIAALVETARSAGLVSQMNASLICEEYASLATFVIKHSARIADHGRSFERDRTPVPKGLKGHVLDLSPFNNVRKGTTVDSDKRQEVRKAMILKVLNKKDSVSIKDITVEIDGYSEKTIQRDLLSLVKDGVLKREGERRWSTYKMASPD